MIRERDFGLHDLGKSVKSVSEVESALNESFAWWFNFGLYLLNNGLGFVKNAPESRLEQLSNGLKTVDAELAMRGGRLVTATLFGGRVVVSHSVYPIILKGGIEKPRVVLAARDIANRAIKIVKERFQQQEDHYPNPRTESDMALSSILFYLHDNPFSKRPDSGSWLGERTLGLRRINIGLIVPPYLESYLPRSDSELEKNGLTLYDTLYGELNLKKPCEIYFNYLKGQADAGQGPSYFGDPYIILAADVFAPMPLTMKISPKSFFRPVSPELYRAHPIDRDCRPSFSVFLGFERNYGPNEKPSPDDFLNLYYVARISPEIFLSVLDQITQEEEAVASQLMPPGK